MKKIKKFIKKNSLDFSDYGSDLNGNCLILAGYLCYLGKTELNEKLWDFIGGDAHGELEQVFEYAKNNQYGEVWKTDRYKKMYKY